MRSSLYLPFVPFRFAPFRFAYFRFASFRFEKAPTVYGLLMALLFCLATQPALAIDKKALRRALSGTDRGVSDYIRDEIRKQVEVLDFLGIEACMHVLDVYAADGYYTFILSKAVGPEGIVYAQNTPRGLRFEEDRMEKQGAIDTALAAGFLITSDSDLLHNPADSHKRSIFDPMLNRNTDRFLLKLQKPE